MQYRDFVRRPEARQRYWARSFTGWPRFRQALPNAAHYALASLEAAGVLSGLLTQNVDRLHNEAGSRNVIELHGALADVECLTCRAISGRDALQERLTTLNPDWEASQLDIAPDGDVEISAPYSAFRVAPCEACGEGPLKPHVVFFGESVPKPVVRAAFDLFDSSSALLIVGSSLAVFSGYRFLLRARDAGIPVGMINLGAPHRGMELVDHFVDARATDALMQLAQSWS